MVGLQGGKEKKLFHCLPFFSSGLLLNVFLFASFDIFLMLLFLVSGISLIFFIKALFHRPLPPWVSDTRYLPLCVLRGLSKTGLSFCCVFQSVPKFLMAQRKNPCKRVVTFEENELQPSLLDLPELALECILEKLPPAGLCTMAGVCSSLRERCTCDYLWERHMRQKWGSVMSQAAFRQWQWFMASKKNSDASERIGSQGLIKFIWQVWPFSRFRSETNQESAKHKSYLPVDSIMSWYLALETGKFSFPAQVYNREHGHVGFVLSCYDAELSYHSESDTFQARYPPHGRKAAAVESDIEWERLRAPPVDTSPHELHASECLSDLRPGDHVEIQWRRNKEFPYGWWYGAVGHLESCDGNEYYCQCHSSDSAVLEFKQYTPGSRWRRATVSRKDHQEEGNEADGFYGGIRKLYSNGEIAVWKNLWPADILE